MSDEAEGHEPIVAVRAILAERVIQEKDDSLSIIRIIDKLKLTATRVGPDPQIAPQTDLEPVDVRFPVVAHIAVLVRQIDGPPTTQQLELEITGPDGTSILKAAPVDVPSARSRPTVESLTLPFLMFPRRATSAAGCPTATHTLNPW